MEYRIESPRNGNAGFIAGLFGCLFGLLGIFTIGLIFVPLAALCALVGVIRAIMGGSMLGTGTSLLAGVLAGCGFIFSPSLWLILAGGILASKPPVYDPPPAPRPRSASEQRLVTALQKQATSQPIGSTCYMDECFEQQIQSTSTEANGSTRVLVKFRDYEAAHPEVTVGQPKFATFWVSCQSFGGYVENEARVKLWQPNPEPTHATEPADILWKAVCAKVR